MNPLVRHWQLLHDRFQRQWFNHEFKTASETAAEELAAARSAYGAEHPAVVRALLDLGVAHQASDQPEQAEKIKTEAQHLMERLQARALQNPDDPRTADLLLFEADRLWNVMGDTPEVMEKLQRAIAIREKYQGVAHAETAQAIARLAEVEDLRAHFTEAEPLYRRALTIFEAAKETDDPILQKTLEGLSRTLMHLERPRDAWPYLEKALASAGRSGVEKRSLYALLISAAVCRRALNDQDGGARFEAQALALLPKANPGAEGFHV